MLSKGVVGIFVGLVVAGLAAQLSKDDWAARLNKVLAALSESGQTTWRDGRLMGVRTREAIVGDTRIQFDLQGRLVELCRERLSNTLFSQHNPPRSWTVLTKEAAIHRGRNYAKRLGFGDSLKIRHVSLPKHGDEEVSIGLIFSHWKEPYPLRNGANTVTMSLNPQGELVDLIADYSASLGSSKLVVPKSQAVATAVKAWPQVLIPGERPGEAFLGYAIDIGFPLRRTVDPPYRVRLCWTVPFGPHELWVDAETGTVMGGVYPDRHLYEPKD
jgi:hypothetical protein